MMEHLQGKEGTCEFRGQMTDFSTVPVTLVEANTMSGELSGQNRFLRIQLISLRVSKGGMYETVTGD